MGIFRFFVCFFLLLLSSASFAVDTDIAGNNSSSTFVLDLALGMHQSCAIRENNELLCWGGGDYEEANNPNLSMVTAVDAGLEHTCAISSGNVSCWGRNFFGQNNIPLMNNATQISVGWDHVCASHDEGLKCWGRNSANFDNIQPDKITSGGKFACYLLNSEVNCWGWNTWGQLDVPVLSNPVDIDAGYFYVCAIDDTGVVCWGDNRKGQGNPPHLENPTQIESGSSHSCALDDTGVVCWGSNDYGQVDVPDLLDPVSIKLGNYHSCAQDYTGVVCWGRNDYGQTDVPELSFTFDEDDTYADVTSAVLDIDANGSFDALTDGLIILRYAFGLRGQSLIDGVISEDAMRAEASDIETYIETLLP
jgi:alpha-tubulin suppressor-like RCC1 family protein